MAAPTFSATPGTRDLLSPTTARMRDLVGVFADEATKAGFGQIVPPMFEDLDVFVRLGESTDVVSKELYAFTDAGERQLALRPEFTASVCRAYVQHRPTTPWKAWYAGPAFRQEKAQRGRYRQFDQVGAEVIGSHDPDLDTELIALAWRFYARLGLGQVRLIINTLGDKADRPPFLDALTAHFSAAGEDLSAESRATLQKNPLRVLDSKREQDAEIIAAAPALADFLSDDAAASFDRVQAGLRLLEVPFVVEPKLVRGLDYYTRTTFEFVSDALQSAQNAVGGGGRYDGLVADLGGPADPGVGFALGVDRTLLACDDEGVFGATDAELDVFVVDTTGAFAALSVVDELRRAGLRADRAYDGRSMKAQMKAANRSGATVAVIVGPDEAAAGELLVRPLRQRSEPEGSGAEQRRVATSDLVPVLRGLLD